MSQIGITELLVVLAIVIMVFGTKRLRTMGGDLGGALKSFRSAVRDRGDDAQDHAGTDDPKATQPEAAVDKVKES